MWRAFSLFVAVLPGLMAQTYRLATLAEAQPVIAGGPAARSFIGQPVYMAARNGELYLSLGGTWQIHRITADGTLTVFAGSGAREYSGDGGPARAAGLSAADMAFDSRGNLYFLDGLRLRRIAANGIVQTVAGSGQFCTNNRAGRAMDIGFCGLTGVAVDANDQVYLSEQDSNPANGGQRIWRVDANGTAAVFQTGLKQPLNLQFAPNGDLYIRDGSTVRVRRAEGGLETVSGASGRAARYIAVDREGTLFLIDNDTVLAVRNGQARVVAGVAGFRANGNDGPNGGRLEYPVNLTCDAAGNLFIADTLNGRVLRRTPAGDISTVAGTLDLPPGARAPIFPIGRLGQGIVATSNGVYFLDMVARQVRRIAPDGTVSAVAGSGLSGPGPDGAGALQGGIGKDLEALARDAAGGLYVSSWSTTDVRYVTGAGVFQTIPVAARFGVYSMAVVRAGELYYTDGAGLQRWGSGSSELLSATFASARLAVGPTGTLYALAAGSLFRVSEGQAVLVSGARTAGAADDNVPAAQASLRNPSVVTVDRTGAIYIAAGGDFIFPPGYVWRIGTDGIQRRIAGGGEGSTAPGAPALGARIPTITGISVDDTGRVFLQHYAGIVVLIPESGPGSCTLRLTPGVVELPAAGGVASVDVVADSPYCPWATPAAPASWLRAASPAGQPIGRGNGQLTLVAGRNDGDAREASVNLAGGTVAVRQAAGVPVLAASSAVLAPGAVIRLTGEGFLAAGEPATLLREDEAWPTNLLGTCVQVDGEPASLRAVEAGAVTFLVPALAERASAKVTLGRRCGTPLERVSAPMALPYQAARPELLSDDPPAAAARVLVAARLSDGARISRETPSRPGDELLVYARGLGQTEPALPVNGLVTEGARVALPVAIRLAGLELEVVPMAQSLAGFNGLYEMRFLIPDDVPAGELRITVAVGGLVSPGGFVLPVGR